MKTIRICICSLINSFKSIRGFVFLIIMLLYSHVFVAPIADMARLANLRLTPMIYPILLNDKMGQLTFLSGYVLLLSITMNTAVSDQALLPRIGYVSAALEKVVHMVVLLVLYQVIFIIFTHSLLLGITDWTLTWGEGWKLLCVEANWSGFHTVFYPSSFLINEYSAVDAYMKTVVLESALLLWIGLVAETLRSLFRPAIAVFTSIGIALSDIFFYNMLPIPLRILSPVSLAMLSTFQEPEVEAGVTEDYAICFYTITLISLVAIHFVVQVIWRKKKRMGCVE